MRKDTQGLEKPGVRAPAPTATELLKASQEQFASGNVDAAIVTALRALDGKADRPKHFEHLAKLLCEAGMGRAAEIVVRQALDLGFDKPVMFGLLARALFKQKRYEDAIAAVDRVLAADPNLGGYVRYRAMILGKMERAQA